MSDMKTRLAVEILLKYPFKDILSTKRADIVELHSCFDLMLFLGSRDPSFQIWFGCGWVTCTLISPMCILCICMDTKTSACFCFINFKPCSSGNGAGFFSMKSQHENEITLISRQACCTSLHNCPWLFMIR